MIFSRHLLFFIVCIIGTGALFWMAEIHSQEGTQQNWQTELQQIDAEIRELQNEKNRFLSAARRYEHQGMRWQFQQSQTQEARRAFRMADIKREAANMVQARIDALNTRRAQILQEHPEAHGF
jgi:predicted ribosome quality control (RQC) complex YloA/Tae2 family protein